MNGISARISRWGEIEEAGTHLPAGDLARFTDPGVSMGVGGAFWLHDDVAVRADGDFAALNGRRDALVSEAVTPDGGLPRVRRQA